MSLADAVLAIHFGIVLFIVGGLLLTWAGAYAVYLVVLAVGGPAMAGWPMALSALVLSGLMVAAMTWIIVPVVTRLFRGWLLR